MPNNNNNGYETEVDKNVTDEENYMNTPKQKLKQLITPGAPGSQGPVQHLTREGTTVEKNRKRRKRNNGENSRDRISMGGDFFTKIEYDGCVQKCQNIYDKNKLGGKKIRKKTRKNKRQRKTHKRSRSKNRKRTNKVRK